MDLVFPRRCFVCTRRYSWLCDACTADFVASGPVERAIPVSGSEPLRVMSATVATPPMLDLLTAYKDGAWGILAPHLAVMLTSSPAFVAELNRATAPGIAPTSSSYSACRQTYCVTVPQTRSAYKRRGWTPLETLAGHLGLRTIPVLAFTRFPGDQSRLNRDSRLENLAFSMVADAERIPAGSHFVILDDIVTTGATLSEATRALAASGAERVTAVTVASVIRGS